MRIIRALVTAIAMAIVREIRELSMREASSASRSAFFDLCPRIAQTDGPIED